MKNTIALFFLILLPTFCQAQIGSFTGTSKNSLYSAVYRSQGTLTRDGQVKLKGEVGLLKKSSGKLTKGSFNGLIARPLEFISLYTGAVNYKDEKGKFRNFPVTGSYDPVTNRFNLAFESGSFGRMSIVMKGPAAKNVNINGSWNDFDFTLGKLKVTEDAKGKIKGHYLDSSVVSGGYEFKGLRKGANVNLLVSEFAKSFYDTELKLRLCPSGETLTGLYSEFPDLSGEKAKMVWCRNPVRGYFATYCPEDYDCKLVLEY